MASYKCGDLKKISVLYIVVFLGFFSCSKENSKEIVQKQARQTETIPLSVAIENLGKTIDAISFHTKAEERPEYDGSDVLVLGKNSLTIDTKGEGGMEIPDTLLYIVNFKDEEGFAVLAADSRISMPVLCITESGKLQERDFEEAIQMIQSKTKASSSGLSEMGESFVPALLLSSVLSKLDNSREGGHRDGEGGGGGEGGGEGNDIDYDSDYPFLDPNSPPLGGAGVGIPDPLGPYVMTKWGQSVDPFNRYTPNNYPAGCTCIALAQLLLANRYSNTMEFNSVICDWDEMESVYNYQNFQSLVYNGSTEGKEQVANFLAGLGSSSYLNLIYEATGSYPHIFEDFGLGIAIKNVMLDLGYSASCSTNLATFSDNLKIKTYDMLRDGYPVIVTGLKSGSFIGHAWLVDGFRCVVTLENSGYYFHINWGWRGHRDGYYNIGVFNTNSGIYAHPVYDDPSLLHSSGGVDANYSWCFTVIDYTIE